jgi:DNA-binding response OmpR family regulator
VVDDDVSVREALMAVLVEEGYIAVPAGGGLQALALAASTPLDLVLLDLNLPGQNGWDTFERLTAEHPTEPVIIITARSNQMFTAVGAGAGALLEKPLDIPTLLQTIARLLTASPAAHLARLAGQKADFFYSAGQVADSELPGNAGEHATSDD